MRSGLLSRPVWLPAALLLAVVAVLYGHTLQAPFYLDDQWAIVDKFLLRDLPATFGKVFSQRGLSNLSFAINFRLTGLSLPSLHLTNILLHAGCALFVWRLLLRLLGKPWLALLGALLFAAHPLQTQAVTYLVQRATVLGAFFFFLAFLLYLRARDVLVGGARRNESTYLLPWGGAIICGGCAVLAKENTAPLFAVLFVYDRLFPLPVSRNIRQQLCDYLPFVVVPLLLGIKLLAAADAATPIFPLASLEGSTPLTYLVTEFSVLWIYLRLLILPLGQALEHDYPVTTQLLSLQNISALAGLLLLVGLVWRLRRSRPLLAFGGAWWFLTLMVESSIIPLDPLFEHRLYLPMFGFVLVVCDGSGALLGSRRAAMLMVIALTVCIPLSWQRNSLWNDPIRLYEDNLRQVPGSERAGETLAILYARAGRFADERRQLEATLRQYPRNYIVYINLAKVYAEGGRMTEAFSLIEEGMRQVPTNPKLYEAAAELAELTGDSQLAVRYLQNGLAMPGGDRAVLLNDLGVLYARHGDTEQAERAFLDSLAENPALPATWINLGKEYYSQRRWGEALAAFGQALRIEPGNPETLEGLGRSALHAGNAETARWAAGKLRYADRQAGLRLQAAIALEETRSLQP